MNVGIIGCGYIARFHHEGYEQAGACIVHACDIRPEAAQVVRAAQEAGVFCATAYMKRYFPAAQQAKALQAGQVVRVQYAG